MNLRATKTVLAASVIIPLAAFFMRVDWGFPT